MAIGLIMIGLFSGFSGAQDGIGHLPMLEALIAKNFFDGKILENGSSSLIYTYVQINR
ncbi:MAG: hypothetical protein U0T36_05585 [Saprospiraceae bacterium]